MHGTIVRPLLFWNKKYMSSYYIHREYETLPLSNEGSKLQPIQGIGGRGGGLAEYIAVDQGSVHVLPAGISCEHSRTSGFIPFLDLALLIVEIGALMEPLAVVWHAVKRSNFTAGDSVLIIGAGPVCHIVLYDTWSFI